MRWEEELDARLGGGRAGRRRELERSLWARKRGRLQWWHPAAWLPMRRLVEGSLALVGLREKARAEFFGIELVENEVGLANLPAAFDGYRLAQLSDLHLDIDPDLMAALVPVMRRARFDRVVVTGDYHDVIGRDWSESLELMRRLIPELGAAPLAILGNHDRLEMVPELEAAGLRFLLNENVVIERGGERIWICGVDDPDHYKTHDLNRARAGVPAAGCAILLAHTPEVYREAAAAGYALMVCGHTHGGQICLPGGFPVVRKAPVPRAQLAGRWTCGGMAGYTSRGTGGCTATARLNCPPEVTIHTLRCAR